MYVHNPDLDNDPVYFFGPSKVTHKHTPIVAPIPSTLRESIPGSTGRGFHRLKPLVIVNLLGPILRVEEAIVACPHWDVCVVFQKVRGRRYV